MTTEEWRSATAALFDPTSMRERLHAIRSVRVGSGGGASFGEISEALLYVSWLTAQTEREIAYELLHEGSEPGVVAIEIHFQDGSTAALRGDRDRGVVISSGGTESAMDCVTRSLARKPEDLIVRLLKKPEVDRVYLGALKVARHLAQ